MKNLFYLAISLIILFPFNDYCQYNSVTGNDKSIYYYKPKIIDSTLVFGKNKYKLNITLYPSKKDSDFIRIIGYTDKEKVIELYANNYIDIIITKNDELLFKKIFKKNDFSKLVPQKYLIKSVIDNIFYESINEKGIQLRCSICTPFTDVCDEISLLITNDGRSRIRLIEEKEEGG